MPRLSKCCSLVERELLERDRIANKRKALMLNDAESRSTRSSVRVSQA
jgi:hypothetical protein